MPGKPNILKTWILDQFYSKKFSDRRMQWKWVFYSIKCSKYIYKKLMLPFCINLFYLWLHWKKSWCWIFFQFKCSIFGWLFNFWVLEVQKKRILLYWWLISSRKRVIFMSKWPQKSLKPQFLAIFSRFKSRYMTHNPFNIAIFPDKSKP